MTRSLNRAACCALGAAAALALAGCVVAPAQPYYTGQPYYGASTVVVSPMEPPPPLVEAQIMAPGPGYLWIGGYWTWSSGRHVWTAGHWEAPRPGYRWVPRTWSRGGDGWHQYGGHWERH